MVSCPKIRLQTYLIISASLDSRPLTTLSCPTYSNSRHMSKQLPYIFDNTYNPYNFKAVEINNWFSHREKIAQSKLCLFSSFSHSLFHSHDAEKADCYFSSLFKRVFSLKMRQTKCELDYGIIKRIY